MIDEFRGLGRFMDDDANTKMHAKIEEIRMDVKLIKWIVLFTIMISWLVLLCGCAGNGVSFYDDAPLRVAVDAGAPLYYPQDVWVRRIGQPDELVTVFP